MRYLICALIAFVVKSTPLTADSCFVVPLYRLYNPTSDNHFYTTSVTEANNATTNLGYIGEGSPGFVSTSPCKSSFEPVYRLYKEGNKDDYFYTSSEQEAVTAATNLGYIREGIAFYCPAEIKCGASLPLYRYWRGTDHFYTTDENEGTQNVVAIGGTYEGVLCNIWPADISDDKCQEWLTNLVPLNRLYNPASNFHFYTASEEEANTASTSLGFTREDSPGLVTTNSSDCQCGDSYKPVFRLHRSDTTDEYFYTINNVEARDSLSLGYTRQGIAFYCSANADECGASRPLHRYLLGTDHFYTTDQNEGTQNMVASGGTYVGIMCYIWPPK